LALASNPTTYKFKNPLSAIDEGSLLTLYVESSLAKAGQTIYWKLTGTAADTARFADTSATVTNALTGTGTTDSNGKFQIVKSILADNKTQGATQLTVILYSDAARTQQVGTTGTTTVTVNDTSKTPTYSFVTPPASVNEGANLTLNVASSLAKAGQTIYWKLTGTAADTARFADTSATVTNALTGTGTTDSNGKFQIVKSILADNKTQGATQLTVTLYSDAGRSQQVGTTTIGVNDTSTTPAAFTKQISPSSLLETLGVFGDPSGTLQGGGYGKQWGFYINKTDAAQYPSISAASDKAFATVTGKTYSQLAAVFDPILQVYGSSRAGVEKLSNEVFVCQGNAKGEWFLYNSLKGKSYMLPIVETTYGEPRWAPPQISYQDSFYGAKTLSEASSNPTATINSYKSDGSIKWSKTFASGESNGGIRLSSRHPVAILPNGNIAIGWQDKNSTTDSTISILRATDGFVISQSKLSGSALVGLYCTFDGTLWGVNIAGTPIKILSSGQNFTNFIPIDFQKGYGGITSSGDLIVGATFKQNSSDFTATIIKAADLPYLSTTFGNFSTTTAKDTLTGTSFADTFAFSTTPNYSSNGSTSDVITNFNPTEGDLIKLSKSAFGISSGGLSPTFAQVNSASSLATQLGSSTQIVYDQSTGFLYNNQDGSLTNGCGSGGGIFAVLTNKSTLLTSNLQFI